MMSIEHPITPPPELVIKWADRCNHAYAEINYSYEEYIATQAARWGADQELEACKQVILEQRWFSAPGFRLDQLHNARRPKPPSLKQQALDAWDRLRNEAWRQEIDGDLDFVRRALEALPDE